MRCHFRTNARIPLHECVLHAPHPETHNPLPSATCSACGRHSTLQCNRDVNMQSGRRVLTLTVLRTGQTVRFFAAKASHGNNLVFLGAPGVGKGTFATRIAPMLGVPAISTGDIIRAEIKAGSALGNKCKEFSNAGKLVPDEIVSEMVRQRLSKPDAQNGWILVSIRWSLARAGPCTCVLNHETLNPVCTCRTDTLVQCNRPRIWMQHR